ncbi:MAG TPA: glycoside hydrolase family 11 protein [Polyangiaceae bacterium]
MATIEPTDLPGDSGDGGTSSGSAGTPAGGKATGGSGGGASGSAPKGGSTSAGSTSGGNSTGGQGTGGSVAGTGPTAGNFTGGAGAGGTGIGGQNAGGSVAGTGITGGSFTGGGGAGGTGIGGAGTGGKGAGGSLGGGGSTGGIASGGAGTGGLPGGTGGTGGPIEEPDCNAAMPSGGTQKSGNGTGGEGNLAWEIWSNTGQGQLTHYDVPAFIATWNNSGGYLGRLGYEWGGFGDEPVPHDQRGEITAQYVSKKTGSAGGYSYVGMYGWTTNPCVEWYIVDDSYNNMPINPGSTTNKGEVQIDGGTYIMYTRPTTGTGGTRCSGTTNWMQYYSVRRTARTCGIISLSEHFRSWQSLGMDMTGELLEAKILVEVGGGVGNVQLPIANVIVQ